MRAINLLPTDDVGEGRRLPPLPILVGCGGVVLVIAVLAVMFMSASSKVTSERSALAQAQAAHAAVPAPAAPPAINSQLPQQRETRVLALSTALGQRVVWDRLLREVSQVVPSDVWIVTLNATAPVAGVAAATTPSAAAPTGFTVSGCTFSQDSVARFLARLDVVPDLSAMTLGSSGVGAGATGAACPGTMVSFTLIGNLQVAAGTSS
jgi:Tfp pilus assembly protein PilN